MIRDNYLDIAKLTTNTDVLRLFQIVARHGGVLRFVGGAVRDALKNIKSYDLNLATDLSPEELFEICADEGLKTIPLGLKEGSTGIDLGNTIVEVSSLYKYIMQKDGSAKIEYTDNWEEDAARRDLTINAVYADENGNVFDYYNGIDDLEKGYVRFIGSAVQKIKEDYLRILRYFRFYAMFGLEEPNRKAVDACAENCAGLKKVPMERIRVELAKLLQTPNAPRAIRLMKANGILDYIMPSAGYVDDLERFNRLTDCHSFADEALLKLFIVYRPDVKLAENLAVRFKLSRRQKQLFVALAENSEPDERLADPKFRRRCIYLSGVDYTRAKLLTDIAQTGKAPSDLWSVYNSISLITPPEFPLKGKDILDSGLADEQQVGRLLKMLKQLWLDSDFSLTKEQLLSYIGNLKEVV